MRIAREDKGRSYMRNMARGHVWRYMNGRLIGGSTTTPGVQERKGPFYTSHNLHFSSFLHRGLENSGFCHSLLALDFDVGGLGY